MPPPIRAEAGITPGPCSFGYAQNQPITLSAPGILSFILFFLGLEAEHHTDDAREEDDGIDDSPDVNESHRKTHVLSEKEEDNSNNPQDNGEQNPE